MTTNEKPKCPLIGANGNIFNLLGMASRTLRENGMREQAKEIQSRVTASGSYSEALNILGEYVEICSAEEMNKEPNEGIAITYRYTHVFPSTQMEVVSKLNNIMTISSRCIEKQHVLWYNVLSVDVDPAKATVWKGFYVFSVFEFRIERIFNMRKPKFQDIFCANKKETSLSTSVEVPDERLRVFISSAQSNEGGFAWSEVRRRIKDYLKECLYLNPFIIEDEASPMQSEQRYQRQLLRADIVVLLVKGEVRKGTATEYALATKHKKPLLIYFLDDGSMPELSAVELKKNVQMTDYCTYRSMSSFDGIEKAVRKNVIESVICYFQDRTLHYTEKNSDTDTMVLTNEAQQTKHSIPTKTDIGLFSSSYNHIFDLLNLPQVKGKDSSEQSVLHNLGVAALDWLISGTGAISDEDVLQLIECHYAQDALKVDAMILAIVLQCFEDEYWPVRRMACNCLIKMLVTKYKDRAERKLYEVAIDPSHYVRNHLLHKCRNGEITDVSISNRIIDILKNDANYAIREYANN